MKSIFRLWLAFVLATATQISAQTYPGTPVLTIIPNSPVSCGLRMYAAGQVQTYCYYLPAGAPPVTVCNHLNVVPSPTVDMAPFDSCGVIDRTAQIYYSVDWFLWSTGTSTKYQILFESIGCTPPTTNLNPAAWGYVCGNQQIIPVGPPITLTSGTLQ